MDLFGFVFLFLSLNEYSRPKATAEQTALVKQLASDDFSVREDAQIKLEAMQEKAIVPLEEFGMNNPDPEVRYRSDLILRKLEFETFGNIYKLPFCTSLFKIRNLTIDEGKSLYIPPGTAKAYYERAGGSFGEPRWDIGETEGDKETACQYATYLFLKDLQKSNYTQDEIKKVIKSMREQIEKKGWIWHDIQYDEDSNIIYPGQYRYNNYPD
jgi:hypothetical protein